MVTFITVIDWIFKALGLASPIIILIVTIHLSRKDKKRSNKETEISTLKIENDELKQKVLNNDQICRDKKVEDLSIEVGKLQKGLEDVNGKIDTIMEGVSEEVAKKVSQSIERALGISILNLEYSQSLSCVVTAIGEGLRDNKINGTVSAAILDHQKKEQDIFKSLTKISC